MGGPRTSFDIFLKQQHGVLIPLLMFAQPLLRGQRAILGEPLKVALNRRIVDPKPTGGLAFGDALAYRLYYLGARASSSRLASLLT